MCPLVFIPQLLSGFVLANYLQLNFLPTVVKVLHALFTVLSIKRKSQSKLRNDPAKC